MNQTQRIKSKYSFLNFLIFLFSPLFSYFIAIRNYEISISKNIVWLFSAFFGYCIQIDSNSSFDSAVYVDKFLFYYDNELNYTYLFENFFSNRGHIEIVENLIAMTVAQFTNNYHFLLLSYGVFFGYFFSRNIAYMYEHSTGDLKKGYIWLTLSVTFVIPIWNMNGFDFWTASLVFIYVMLPVIYEKKYSRIVFLVICPLIHFSFYFMIAISLMFFLIKNFEKIIVVVFILSFFITGVDNSQFDFLLGYFPDIITERTEAYINSSKSNTGGNILRFANLIYSLGLYYVFYKSYTTNKSYIDSKGNLKQMYLFVFYIIAVFNVLSLIPSVGRFLLIGQTFLFITLFFILNNKDFENYHKLYLDIKKIRIILILYWTLLIFRYLFPIVGIGSILSNPFLVQFFIDDDYVIGNILDFLN